jgi:hypothetical protein
VSTPEDQTVAAGHSVELDPARWQELFEELLGRVAGRFGRVDPARPATRRPHPPAALVAVATPTSSPRPNLLRPPTGSQGRHEHHKLRLEYLNHEHRDPRVKYRNLAVGDTVGLGSGIRYLLARNFLSQFPLGV